MKPCPPSKELELQLSTLPNAPGVYIFKDTQGEIIYIGKALGLKSRVRSYWNQTGWAQRPKLAVMMPKVATLETILTNSEKEALILEATLVRQHMPRYNVALKDDKKYPWLAITYDEPFPRLIMVREPQRYRKENPKAKLFGPYVLAGQMWETVRILRKVFPMRQRKTPLFKDRPCMNFHIGLCLGPCQKLVQEEPYDLMVAQVEKFLAGRQKEVVQELKKQMEKLSEELEFEEAAKLRNRIFTLEKVIEQQQVFFQDQTISQDILAEAHTERFICFGLLKVREGKLISSDSFSLPLTDKTSFDEAYESFVDQYYTSSEDIALPKELLLAHKIESIDALTDLLSARSQRNVSVQVPARGKKLSLIEMAQKNAKLALDKQLHEHESKNQQALELLTNLQDELSLMKLPYRIECFDISNIQGTDNVASMVVFENGAPKNSDYRTFKIKSVEGEPNDFASMNEVVTRRYKRLKEENKSFPDLIVIDGGKGQLNAALDALSSLDILDVDIIGLAKRQEEIYLPGKSQPQLLSRSCPALHLLQHVRDEAHRFAVTFHRKRRAKRSLVSNFDSLPKVGPDRRKKLQFQFGTFAKLKEASLEEIKQTPGISTKVAQGIYNALHEALHESDDSEAESHEEPTE